MTIEEELREEYVRYIADRKASGAWATMSTRVKNEWMRGAGLLPPKPYSCGKISSHGDWYHGKWVTDTCGCGHKFRVPKGSKGKYRCDCCANRDY